MSVIERVSRTLESIGAPYALIGGRAVGARGYPRMTLDYDFLTSDARILKPEIWKHLEQGGAAVDPRKGDVDDPLAGVSTSPSQMVWKPMWCWRNGNGSRRSSNAPSGLMSVA